MSISFRKWPTYIAAFAILNIFIFDTRYFFSLDVYINNGNNYELSSVHQNITYSAWWLLESSNSNITIPKRSSIPYYELCEDCRLNPSAGGKLVLCSDRVDFLKARYKTPELEARKAVMESKPNCNMTRFPVELLSPSEDNGEKRINVDFESMFTNFTTSNETIPQAKDVNSIIGNLTIYFYETIPKDMGIDLERNISALYASKGIKEENMKADLAIIQLFRTYHNRIYDPNKADIFVVPFPHAAHCLVHPGWANACGHVPSETIQKGVLDNLPYSKGNEKRHLFINSHEIYHSHKLLGNVPLSLTIGPRLNNGGYQILVPYLNDQRAFQPSVIRQRSREWWTKPRKYSLVYFHGSMHNKAMKGASPRKYRMYFIEEVQKNWNTTPDVGGLPYVIQNIANINATQTSEKEESTHVGASSYQSIGQEFFGNMYSESVFCPVLPGDSATQKRFFDVIMMGCIPVVLSFNSTSIGARGRSWHTPEGSPFYDSYPWSKGSDSMYDQLDIDYPSFVVEAEGVERIKPVLEELMQNYTEIRRRQEILMRYAAYFSYGMGSDSHKFPDAFTKILESLQFYLSKL